MIQGAPIGDRFKHCTFDSFEVTDDNREAFEACKQVAHDMGPGILLMGGHGLGKTHLLVAMMRAMDSRHASPAAREAEAEDEAWVKVPSAVELIRSADPNVVSDDDAPALTPDEFVQEMHIEYWPMLDLASELRSDVAHGSQDVSRRCRECDFLFLDDLGAERVTDFILEEIERIVDWRYRLLKPTAVATNLTSFKEIADKYGKRAISRWTGSGNSYKVTGVDRRPGMELR